MDEKIESNQRKGQKYHSSNDGATPGIEPSDRRTPSPQSPGETHHSTPTEKSNLNETKGFHRAHGTDLTGIFRQVAVPTSTPPSSREGSFPGSPSQSNMHQTPNLPIASSGRHPEEELGFTQMFQALRANSSPSTTDPFQQEGEIPVRQSQQELLSNWNQLPRDQGQRRVIQTQGEFTQLFQRLDQQEELSEIGPFYHEGLGSSAIEPLGGGFTQLLRTLSSEDTADLQPGSSPNVQPLRGGPGEFTRIISHSALREEMKRDAQQNSQPTRNTSPVSAEPTSPSHAQQNILSNAGPLSAMVSTDISKSSPLDHLFSAATTFPVPKVPTEAQLPTTSSKLQQYLPLLLTANLFVMLLVLILAILILLRHR